MSYVNVYNDNLRHCTCTPFSVDDAIPINFRIITNGDFAIKYNNDTDMDVIDN